MNKIKNKAEILYLSLCGLALNGYSKSFRQLLLDKNQDERIVMMKDILKEQQNIGNYEKLKEELKDLIEVL